MKTLLKALAMAGVAFITLVTNGKAEVQQSISISFSVYNQTNNIVRVVGITTKDVIANMVGTNVPGGKLWLVTPDNPTPDGSGNIGAFLRATDAHGNILAETTSDTFNVYQASSSHWLTRTYAFNQFSFAISGLSAEVYGMGVWFSNPRGPGGQGSFRISVNGHCSLGGTTDGARPCIGVISGGTDLAAP